MSLSKCPGAGGGLAWVVQVQGSIRLTPMRQFALSVFLSAVALTGCSQSGVPNRPSNQIRPEQTSSFTDSGSSESWDKKAAASYLDQRASWWSGWSLAARDHDTFCVSCHTTIPYVLARPTLRKELNEEGPSVNERTILGNVLTRVRLWRDVKPYYDDGDYQRGNESGSRATESVLNAFILVNFDAQNLRLTPDTITALDEMWALQKTNGDQKGSWSWQEFNLKPWEAADSEYFGAIIAAVAVGRAPSNYALSPRIQANLKSLRDYLAHNYRHQSLLNRALLLWASSQLPGILQPSEIQAIIDEVLRKQNTDGGWNLASTDWTLRRRGISSLITLWRREDWTAQEPGSDGCATGIILFALEAAGVPTDNPLMSKGLSWLRRSQDAKEGDWRATSLNKHRNPDSNIGRFMNDAATGFAVLALTRASAQDRTSASASEYPSNPSVQH